MAKSKGLGNSIGVLVILGAIVGIGAYALSKRGQIKSKLDGTVFGAGGSISENPSDSQTPDAQSNVTDNGIIQQAQRVLSTVQQQSPKVSTTPYTQQQSSKPMLSTAVSNYNKIINNAISSGYSGIPNKSVFAPKSSRGHITRTVTRNDNSKPKGRGNPNSKLATNSSITNRINNLRSSKPAPKGRPSRGRRSTSTSALASKKKAEASRATATRRRLYGF